MPMPVRVCVSVMDVLQMVSAPSNYAVDTGGSPQRSLRTHTHREENQRVDVLEVLLLNLLFLKLSAVVGNVSTIYTHILRQGYCACTHTAHSSALSQALSALCVF